MLYVSTRNFNDSYTAHRALHEERTPNGGFYVPMRLPFFSQDALSALKAQSCSETIAQVLNLFFSLHINAWDVECAIGRDFFRLQSVNQKIIFAELWRNPEGNFSYLLNSLYALLLDKNHPIELPVGWPRIATEIAVLFGLFSAMDYDSVQGFDIAATVDDMSTMTAVLFAKNMGLPVNLTICACNEDSIVWDLTSKGEFSTRNEQPVYLECFIYSMFGQEAVLDYLDASSKKTSYSIGEERTEDITNSLYAAVVSDSRIDTIVSGVYSTSQCLIDSRTALTFGSLQDYRSQTGINADTVILAKQRAK